MAWYFSTPSDIWTITDAPDLANAIIAGREYHEDGEAFEVAGGESKGPWPELFNYDRLADHIDDWNEDNSHEEGFCGEAGLGRAELEPLLTEINAVWTAFIARHNPRSNLLDLGPVTAVPATEEYRSWQSAEEERVAAEEMKREAIEVERIRSEEIV